MPWTFSNTGIGGGFGISPSGNPGGGMNFAAPTAGIVTSGLVMNLDAGDVTSYPGSGTTWTDLSGNTNTATLVNGPTFNSGNNGYIITDGSDDYIEVTTRNTNLEFQPNQPHSAFCWVYNLSNTTAAILSNMNSANPFQGWNLLTVPGLLYAQLITAYPTNALSVAVAFDYTGNANKWVNVGYTYDGSSPTTAQGCLNSINFYVNGQLFTSGKAIEPSAGGIDGFNTTSETTTYPTSQRFRIASRWASGAASVQAALNIAQVVLYNKVLTSSEVLQNFNTLRGRFGI
jgi:hypothetical protein